MILLDAAMNRVTVTGHLPSEQTLIQIHRREVTVFLSDFASFLRDAR